VPTRIEGFRGRGGGRPSAGGRAVSRQGRRLNHGRQVGGAGGAKAVSHEEGDRQEFDREEDEDDRR
jgi:hypothetical protein